MEKKQPYGDTLREKLLASAKDRLHKFLLADGAIRGAIMNGTRMVNEMRANHGLGILETLVLGRAYLGAGLMAADLKGNDRISIKFDCSGPIKGLVAEANAFGEVRGFLKQVPIPIDNPMESFSLSPFFGAGFLSVTKYLEDAKQPFTGQVILKYGNIAKDLANYYLASEQVPTAFNLSIKFDTEGHVTGAGGLFLQALPRTDDDLAAKGSPTCLHWVKNSLPTATRSTWSARHSRAMVRDSWPTIASNLCATATGNGCAAC